MKYKIVFLLVLGVTMFSCEKDKDCNAQNEACKEGPATDELCDAYFVRWFYIEGTNSCKQISYSGCNVYGFATKEECEECGCD